MDTQLQRTAYQTVHSHPGGARALAAEVGMNASVLDSKVNPKNKTHHLRLDEAVAIMARSENYSLLYVLCDQLGFKPPEHKGQDGSGSDVALLQLHASIHKELGDVSSALLVALEDGQFEPNEINEINQQAGEAIQALHDFTSRLNGIHK